MADEILVDLNDLYDGAVKIKEDLEPDEHIPMLQFLATIALCERLDALKKEVADFASWYQAVSPSR